MERPSQPPKPKYMNVGVGATVRPRKQLVSEARWSMKPSIAFSGFPSVVGVSASEAVPTGVSVHPSKAGLQQQNNANANANANGKAKSKGNLVPRVAGLATGAGKSRLPSPITAAPHPNLHRGPPPTPTGRTKSGKLLVNPNLGLAARQHKGGPGVSAFGSRDGTPLDFVADPGRASQYLLKNGWRGRHKSRSRSRGGAVHPIPARSRGRDQGKELNQFGPHGTGAGGADAGNPLTFLMPPRPPFPFKDTNYCSFGLQSREDFHKYLEEAGFFDKLSNVIAHLYEHEKEGHGRGRGGSGGTGQGSIGEDIGGGGGGGDVDDDYDCEFHQRNVAEYLYEQLSIGMDLLPWSEQLQQAKRKRDALLDRIATLEKEKANLMHYVETGERWKKVKMDDNGSSGLMGKKSSSKKRFQRKSKFLSMLSRPSPKKSTGSPPGTHAPEVDGGIDGTPAPTEPSTNESGGDGSGNDSAMASDNTQNTTKSEYIPGRHSGRSAKGGRRSKKKGGPKKPSTQ